MHTRPERHVRPSDRSILVVDDDDELRNTLARQLTTHGDFAVSVAASLAEAEAFAGAYGARYAAFLLDVSLPDGDGRDLCAHLRRKGVTAPIIMLTCWSEEADVVRGLRAGANDYVTKPFRLQELLARLRAHLRGHLSAGDAVFRIGPFIFRPSAKRLESMNKARHIFLTSKEVEILKLLCRSGNRPVPNQTLLREVWGYGPDIGTHTLEAHVYRLRQKIEPDPSFARILVRDRGGYRLDTGAADRFSWPAMESTTTVAAKG